MGQVVNADILSALLTNFRVIFNDQFQAALKVQNWKKIVTEVPSTTDTESYNWLGTVPKMHEWVDERIFAGLAKFGFTLKNKHWASGISVDRDTIEDDRVGIIKPRVLQLAQEAARHPDELVFDLLNVGDATKCLGDYNKYFFATDHAIGDSGSFSNKLTGNGIDTGAHILTDIAAAVTAMQKFKDDKGRVMNLIPDTIVCPPEAVLAIKNALLPAVAGTVRPELEYVKDIISTAYLTDANDWYFLCTSQPVRPIIFQNRKDPEFVALDDPKSDHVFLKREFLYGVDSRYNCGYADPRFAIMIANS